MRCLQPEQAPVGHGPDAVGELLHLAATRDDEEGSVVEGEAEFPTQAGGTLQEGSGRRGHDEGESLQCSMALSSAAGPNRVFNSSMLPTSYNSKAGHVHLEGPSLHFPQKGLRLLQEILIARLEPLDEDRGVNDDLCGRSGSRDSSG